MKKTFPSDEVISSIMEICGGTMGQMTKKIYLKYEHQIRPDQYLLLIYSVLLDLIKNSSPNVEAMNKILDAIILHTEKSKKPLDDLNKSQEVNN